MYVFSIEYPDLFIRLHAVVFVAVYVAVTGGQALACHSPGMSRHGVLVSIHSMSPMSSTSMYRLGRGGGWGENHFMFFWGERIKNVVYFPPLEKKFLLIQNIKENFLCILNELKLIKL